MDFNKFGCERSDIESVSRVVQRNLLIKTYCSHHFGYVNLVDAYYRRFDSNAILSFIIILSTLPILYLCINMIAEKFVAKSMRNLSNRLRISQSLAAISLLSFANTTPELISSMRHSGSPEGTFVVFGVGIGVYIFSTSVTIPYIIFRSKSQIKLPKYMVIKELGFLLVPLMAICVFGLIQVSGAMLLLTFGIIYALYFLATIYIDKHYFKQEQVAMNENSESDRVQDPGLLRNATLESTETANRLVFKSETNISEIFEVELENSEGSEDEEEAEQSSNQHAKHHQKHTFFEKLLEQMIDFEEHSAGTALILLPLNVFMLFTVPYGKNPLMQTKLRYVPMVLSILVSAFLFGEHHVLKSWIFICALSLIFIIIMLEIFKIAKEPIRIFEKIMTVIVSIAWTKLFVLLILDYMAFISFYFSINEIILFTILMSAGNCFSEMLNLGALSRQGSGIMAVLATYSGQLLNLVGALSINTLMNAKMGVFSFDLFQLNSSANHHEDGHNATLMPVGSLFLSSSMAFAVILVLIHFLYYMKNDFVLKKRYAFALMLTYVGYLAGAISFGYYSKTHPKQHHNANHH